MGPAGAEIRETVRPAEDTTWTGSQILRDITGHSQREEGQELIPQEHASSLGARTLFCNLPYS